MGIWTRAHTHVREALLFLPAADESIKIINVLPLKKKWGNLWIFYDNIFSNCH
jgi:hypothetical protein